jgi:hypothetical protein
MAFLLESQQSSEGQSFINATDFEFERDLDEVARTIKVLVISYLSLHTG